MGPAYRSPIGIYGVTTVAAGVVLGQESAIVAAATTAVCALGLSPIRHRLQRMVDRRLYPRRRAAFEALDALYSEASSGRAQPEALQGVLRTALRDDGLVVGYRVPGSEEYVDPAGRPVSPTGGCLVELDGRAIGVLVPTVDGSSEGLLREVAGRVTALVEVVRLRLELARALREVEASRARWCRSATRNGGGSSETSMTARSSVSCPSAWRSDSPSGASIRVRWMFPVCSTRAWHSCPRQSPSCARSPRESGRAPRRRSRGSRRPARPERPGRHGYGSARWDLPDDVATTAYFVISEAVANAVKHANASRIGLRVVRRTAASSSGERRWTGRGASA